MRPLSEFDRDCPHGHVQQSGRPARIIGEVNNHLYPLVVSYAGEDGDELVAGYTRDGRYYAHTRGDYRDLINAPAPKKRIQGWVNVYRDLGIAHSTIHPNKTEADNCASPARLACIYIDVEEGEGLS